MKKHEKQEKQISMAEVLNTIIIYEMLILHSKHMASLTKSSEK